MPYEGPALAFVKNILNFECMVERHRRYTALFTRAPRIYCGVGRPRKGNAGPKHGQLSPSWPSRADQLFALASIEIDIAGIVIELHGDRALRVETWNTWIERPQFATRCPLVALPPQVHRLMG
jgi:hypothetical protein